MEQMMNTRASAGSNIYTVLALVAVLALIAGVSYVGYKNTELTGQSNPFAVMPQAGLIEN